MAGQHGQRATALGPFANLQGLGLGHFDAKPQLFAGFELFALKKMADTQGGTKAVKAVKIDPLTPKATGISRTKGYPWQPNLAKPLLTRVVFVLPVVRMAPPLQAWGKWVKPCHASSAACTNPVAKAANSVLQAVWRFSAMTANRLNLLLPQRLLRLKLLKGFPCAGRGTKSHP
jgi:hypothetical protein